MVLFHAGLGLFPGGYVGVDVFFVISGYLITSIILGELKSGTFSLTRFYERRIRRILPALFLVLAASTVMAVLWLLPSDLVHFFKSVSYTALFASNYRFYRVKDYFAPEADLQPLIHTWSLAIEEQYYLVFPLAILILHRVWKPAIPLAILVVGAASFALGQRALASDPSAAFFLTPFRIWELMIGSLLAAAIERGGLRVRANGAFAAAGLALIAGAALLFTEATPFPGAYALIPTLGAALVIVFATPETVVGRVLGSKPFVAIGLLSYSAYLWHQPLFAFAKLRFAEFVTPVTMLALCLLAFVLAGLTWFFVEQPVRRARSWAGARLFAIAGAGTIGFFALGHLGENIDRMRLRGDAYARIEDMFRPNDGLNRACRDDGWESPKCRTTQAPQVVLWGNSYAMHLAQALTSSAPDLGVIQATKGACPPVLGVAPYGAKRAASWSRQCLRHNESVLKLLKENPSVRYAVLSSFFTSLTAPGSRLLLSDGTVKPAADVAFQAFTGTLERLKAEGIIPIVVGPPPENGRNHGRCRANILLFGADDACEFRLAESEVKQKHERDFLRRVEALGWRVVWLDAALCPGGECRPVQDGVAIYRDVGHLTVEGSGWLGRELNLPGLIRNARP